MLTTNRLRSLGTCASVSLLLALISGCASIGQQLDQYRARPEPKALALGSYGNGNWVAGSAWRQPSLEKAKEVALRYCQEEATKRGAPARCRVIYENDTFVSEPVAAAAQPAAPPPQVSAQRPAPPPQLPQPRSLTGSGVFISEDGLVLTAEHVIRGATNIEVLTRDGRRVRARVQSASRSLDLAILSTEARAPSFLPVRLTNPLPGARDFTVGYPVPGVLGQEPKVSDGIVNATSGIRDDAGFMQISIPIQPGNSGGPVVTEDGALIGVVTSSAAVAAFLERTGTVPQNVNWAVHSSLAVTLLGKEGARINSRSREQAIADTLRASVLILSNQD